MTTTTQKSFRNLNIFFKKKADKLNAKRCLDMSMVYLVVVDDDDKEF